MKTKVVQYVPRINFNVFKFSGSQRLSDFQTFFIFILIIIYIKGWDGGCDKVRRWWLFLFIF